MSLNNKQTSKIITISVVTVLLFLFCLQSATAADITNSTAGGISKGISDTPNNGTLGLANGIYKGINNSDITIDKNVTIKGTSKSNTVIDIGYYGLAFNVEKRNTLTLYNLTIISNYFYTDGDIADYNSLIHNSNGSITGPGNVVFENCLFINKNKQSNATVVVNASSVYNSNRVNFTATVKDSYGNPLTGDVVFYINNNYNFAGRVPIANGIAKYSLNLPNGNYVVHAVYIGNFYGGPWNIIGQTSLLGLNPKISNNQLSFNVNSFFAPLSFPLPTSGNRYWVDPLNGDDSNPGTYADPKKSILNAYNSALDNSYIILMPGTYNGTNNVGITLDNKLNMTIIGNDTTGSVIITPSTTFMSITAGVRTHNICNMLIIGGSSNVITINADNNAYIDSLVFVNGTSRYIVANGLNINLIVNNTDFLNRYGSADGGAIYGSGGSGNTFDLRIYNSNFENITGNTVEGGVIRTLSNPGPLEIHNSTFKNCDSRSHGGVFCTSGPSFLVYDSKFININSTNSGGGVLWSHGTGDHNFTNTEFINCKASTQAGAIYTTGNVNLDNCTFIDNSAGTTGGAIQTSGSITVKDSNFINNSAGTFGGAISASGGRINITNSVFTNNSAGSSNYGGAIGVSSSSATITVNGASFDNNSAGTFGGAIGVAGGTVNLNNTNFMNNSAGTFGGAIGANAGTINVNNSDFRGNYVSGSDTVYGGALGTPGGTINVYNSEFFNNSARNNSASANSYGGAAGVNGANARINLDNCTVHDNWAKYGGAFGAGASGGIINVNSCPAIFNNYALEYGGVVGLSNTGTITLTNCTNIFNNSAGSYGGVFGVNGGTINVYDSLINNNRADDFGGVVGINGSGSVNLFNSIMNDNIAVNFGGAIGTTGGTVNIRNNSSLNRNKAIGPNGYGGAIGLVSGNINVYDSTFVNNTATTYGGAVGVPTGGSFYANNSVFTHNQAINGYGGAIGSAAGVNIEFCNFTDNIAGTNGGAVAAMGASSVNNQVYSCQFEYNRATTSGNAIYAANRLTAQYNRFFNNTDITGSLNNTLFTNSSQQSNVNINYNWWGDNYHTAVGNTPIYWVVVDVSTPPVLWNGSANYTYTISLNINDPSFNVNRLPMFWGQANFTIPNFYEQFDAHLHGNIIIAQFDPSATQTGYFQVDNWIKRFNEPTNSTPNITLAADLAGTAGKYKDNVILNATFKDGYGYGIAGLFVEFWVEGVNVGNGTTDANGFVTCPYTVASAGNLNYTVVYTGNDPNYNAVTISTLLPFLKLDTRIVVNSIITGRSGLPVALNATIYDEKGRFVENVIIQFYGQGGVFYANATSDSLGQAGITHIFSTSGIYSWYAYFAGNGNYTASYSLTNGTANITPAVNLTIEKRSNVTNGNASVGDYVTYYITVHNYGPDTATNILVSDVLDPRILFSGHNGGLTANYINHTVFWTISSLANGTSVILEIYVRINGTGNIVNVANVSNVTEPNLGNNSTTGDTNFTVPATVNLTIEKTSNVTNGNANYKDFVTYIITVTNHGPDVAYNVVVTDVLDSRLVYLNYNASTGTFSPSNWQWNIPRINVGSTVTLEIYVRINGTGNISNIAYVNTSGEDNIGNNSSNTENITIPKTVNLTITKSSNATSNVGYGDYVSYYITVHNSGPDTATNIIVTDVLDPRLAYLGTNGGNVTYSSHTLSWNISNLAVNRNMTLEILVRINGTGEIVNIANVTNVNEVNIGNNSTNGTGNGTNFTVAKTVNLTLTKTATPSGNVNVNDIIVYTITLTNHGPNNGTNVKVTDLLDSALEFISASASLGSYNQATGLWDIGILNVGVTVHLNITVKVLATGNIINIATVNVTEVNVGDNTTGPVYLSANLLATNTTVNNATGRATENVTIFGTVYDENNDLINGTVNITIGSITYYNVPVVNGHYNLTVQMNVSGNYSVVVRYGGSSRYSASSANNLLNIMLMPTHTTVNSHAGKPSIPVPINGTVHDDNNVPINGTVDIYINGTFYQTVNVVNGIYSLNITFNTIGNFPITVIYKGNNVYRNSSANGIASIDKITTTVEIANSTGRATEDITITGTVTSSLGLPINGLVNISINGTIYTVSVVNGQFSLTVKYNISANYTVIATYSGDGVFEASTTSGWMNVELMPTTTTVDPDTMLRVNFTSNLTAYLKDDNGKAIAGAMVDFYVNGIYVGSNLTDANGKAVYEYMPNSLGFFVVKAVYTATGNRTYLPSEDILNIEAIVMGTKIIIDNITTKPFINTTIPITLVDEFGNPVSNMNVTVIIDGKEYNLTTDSNGRVFVYYTADEAGNVIISAYFNGTQLYRASNSTTALTVEKIITYIFIDNLSITTLDRADFSLSLVDEYGNPLANKRVEIFFDGVSLGTFMTDANGKVFIKNNPLAKGLYSITATYAGDNVYANTVFDSFLEVRLVKTNITVYRVTSYDARETLFVATLVDEFGKPVAYRTVTFMLNGLIIDIAKTDANGRAMLTYLTDSGDYEISVEFLEDDVYEGSMDFRSFSINFMSNNTNNTESEANGSKPGDKNNSNPGDNGTSNPGDNGDSGLDDDNSIILDNVKTELEEAGSTPATAKMLNTGNPIAIFAFCLLSIFLIGLIRKKRN